MPLYNRQVTLKVTQGTLDDDYVFTEGRSIELTGLRMVFTVKNTFLGDPSLGSFQIYNLKQTTKEMFSAEACSIALTVSYEGQEPRVIFKGEVTNSYGIRSGADTIQQVWARDSWRTLESYKPVISSKTKSYSRKTLVSEVISSTPSLGGIKYLGDSESVMDSAKDLNNYTATGTTQEELQDLFDGAELSWYVRDGFVYVTDPNEVLASSKANADFVVSRKTGLLDKPEISYVGLTLSHLMDTRFYPGAKIYVEPNTITYNLGNEYYVPQDSSTWNAKGLFRVMEVTHRGDTRGNTWKSEVTAYYKSEES